MFLVVLGGVVNDEQGVSFDGSSGIDLHIAVGELKVSREGLIDLDACGTIDHESHRPLIVVLDDQHDRLEKIGIPEVLARDEKMSCQRLAHSSKNDRSRTPSKGKYGELEYSI